MFWKRVANKNRMFPTLTIIDQPGFKIFKESIASERVIGLQVGTSFCHLKTSPIINRPFGQLRAFQHSENLC